MRTKQAFKNAVFSVLLQGVLAISGILVPRFFIALYGSAINGLVSSISQFITYMSLVEAGVGAAATVSLYGPLSRGDTDEINGVLAAAKRFYLRSGLLFAALVAVLVIAYPSLVTSEINDTGFTRIMILVLSVNGLTDYFFLGKYRVLLMAAQRGYVLYGIQIIGTIVMAAVSIGQMQLGYSALAVKTTAAVIYILRSAAAIVYAKQKFSAYSFKGTPNIGAFSQRNAALLHQVVGVFANNTAVVLLTAFSNETALAEVSVYSVYNLVAYSLASFLTALINGLTPSFGEVVSNGENEVLRKSYSNYELLLYLLTFVCYACMAVLLYPFIRLYSADFTDGVNYLRWELVGLFTLSGVLQALRSPGMTLIYAAGHYKETRGRAIIELGINLAVSVSLVSFWGLSGVVIGMCASYLYRMIDTLWYTEKHFLPGTIRCSVKRLLRSGVVTAVLLVVGFLLVPQQHGGWLEWLVSAVIYAILCCAVLVLINAIAEPDEFRILRSRLTDIVKRK